MTCRTVITNRALGDLRDNTAVHPPENAARFLERLLNEFDVIEATPESYGARHPRTIRFRTPCDSSS